LSGRAGERLLIHKTGACSFRKGVVTLH
jgi:hypothetical protein